MQFSQITEPDVQKPLLIAALQDMGNVGNIVIDFINKSKKTIMFRTAESERLTYVLDRGGYIEVPKEVWEYRYTKNMVVFGGGFGQPKSDDELHALCQDVIDVAKKYGVKFIYTVGGFHTEKTISGTPKTFVTTTSIQLTEKLRQMGINTTPSRSLITGFNGLILGYAQSNNINGIGLYGELDEPSVPQYYTAKSVIKMLEKLTYQNFGSTHELDIMAQAVAKRQDADWRYDF